MLKRTLIREGQTRNFVVRYLTGRGWEVLEEQNQQIVHRVVVRDWHRVERAIERFDSLAEALVADGWFEVGSLHKAIS